MSRAFHIPRRGVSFQEQTLKKNTRAPSGKKDRMVAVRMTAEGYDSIRLAAHEERISVSAYVTLAINEMRKKKGQEPVS